MTDNLTRTREERGGKLLNQPVTGGINSQLPNALFNDIEPRPGLSTRHEKTTHRLMICLAANGYTVTEIADKSGYTVSAISNILRQPWARARIISMQQEAGMDELSQLIRGEAKQAILRIKDRARNELLQAQAPAICQRADEYLADRYLGKAKQSVEHSSKPFDQMNDAELLKIVQGAVGEQDIEEIGAGAA